MEIVTAVRIYQLQESTWSGDEYEPPKERTIRSFLDKDKASGEQSRLEALAGSRNPVYVQYTISSLLVEPQELARYGLTLAVE